MTLAQSKVTAQGQISVPLNVRRAGRFTSEEIHQALFARKPVLSRSVAEMKEGVRQYARKRYARG